MAHSKIIFSALLLCMATLSGSCTKKSDTQQTNHFVVDAASSSAEAASRLESAVTISAIKLQMPDSVLLNATNSELLTSDRDDIIVLKDLSTKGFFIFDREGRLINHFTRKGQGPEEYNALLGAAVHGDTIYALDFTKIQLYDLDGNHLSTIKDVDGSRGQLMIDDASNIYLSHRFNSKYLVSIYRPDGTLVAEKLPTKEVIQNFSIPSGPEISSMGHADGGIFVAPSISQTIYLLNDTATDVLATFDFGPYNIPGDFFDGSSDNVEASFHNRRNNDGGFIYFDAMYISDNWIVFNATGIPDFRMVMADRRTGHTYTDKTFPAPLKKILGKPAYLWGFDAPTQSFAKVVAGYDLAEALDSYPQSVRLTNCESINEEADDFIVLISME